jgi:hypothetical protein
MQRNIPARSTFLDGGFYKKPRPCPYKFDDDGNWLVKESVESCNIPVSTKTPVIVETKFNGNRGIYEFHDGTGCLFSAKRGCHEKGFPRMTSELLSMYLKDRGIKETILDGEMYLESCTVDGKKLIPGMRKQAMAINGIHGDLLDNCKFSYKVYDILKLDGRILSGLSLKKRKQLISDLLPVEIGIGNVSVEPVLGKEARTNDEITSIASNVIDKGGEGIVIKEPGSKYKWKGRTESSSNPRGWWKVKNASPVTAEIMSGCLGNIGKTGLNALRYRTFQLGICKDEKCDELARITDKGVSHSVTGGDFSGLEKWDKKLHFPVIKMLDEGTAIPFGGFRSVDDVVSELGNKPPFIDGLVAGLIGEGGKAGLPRCVTVPHGSIIASVVGLEFNVDKNGIPKINGPPRLNKIKEGKPDTLENVLQLPSVHY